MAVGIEINATHSKSIMEGFVEARCEALTLGRSLATHQITIRDLDGARLSTVRMTNFLRELKA